VANEDYESVLTEEDYLAFQEGEYSPTHFDAFEAMVEKISLED